MITVRPAAERGHMNHGWLDTHHTFSFANYYDRDHMGFRSLRVINEDRVAAGEGFGRHGHRDMEIITYVLAGALEHNDSMGNGSVMVPGDVQRMSAGTGVMHSEYNHSKTEPVHFLQIWIVPDREAATPGYEQRTFPTAEKSGRLRLVASNDGRDGSVRINQDAALYASVLDAGQEVRHVPAPGRYAWIQVVRGTVALNGTTLHAGDGAAIEAEAELNIVGVADDGDGAEFLLFDLA